MLVTDRCVNACCLYRLHFHHHRVVAGTSLGILASGCDVGCESLRRCGQRHYSHRAKSNHRHPNSRRDPCLPSAQTNEVSFQQLGHLGSPSPPLRLLIHCQPTIASQDSGNLQCLERCDVRRCKFSQFSTTNESKQARHVCITVVARQNGVLIGPKLRNKGALE